MPRASVFLVLFFSVISSAAQITGTPTVIAGWNQFDPALAADGRAALLTRMPGITSVAIGPDGLTLTAGRGFVRQIGADGLVRTLVTDQSMDTRARLAADRQGNIYYGVTLGIQKRTPAGSSVAIAGGGTNLPQEGGVAANTRVQAQGMAVDAGGNLIFSEGQCRCVWRIDNAGVLRTSRSIRAAHYIFAIRTGSSRSGPTETWCDWMRARCRATAASWRWTERAMYLSRAPEGFRFSGWKPTAASPALREPATTPSATGVDRPRIPR